MNRQEAWEYINGIASLAEVSADPTMTVCNVPTSVLMQVADALKPPTPDPDTGLVPCGCGGAAFYHETPGENDMGYVECSQCGIGTPDMFPECAEETWNTAMRFNLDETSENPGIVGHDGQEDEDE